MKNLLFISTQNESLGWAGGLVGWWVGCRGGGGRGKGGKGEGRECGIESLIPKRLTSSWLLSEEEWPLYLPYVEGLPRGRQEESFSRIESWEAFGNADRDG